MISSAHSAPGTSRNNRTYGWTARWPTRSLRGAARSTRHPGSEGSRTHAPLREQFRPHALPGPRRGMAAQGPPRHASLAPTSEHRAERGMRVVHRDRGKSAAGGPGRKMRVPFANNAAAAFPEPPRSKAVVLVSVSGGWHLQHVRISGLYHPGAMSPDPRSRRRQSARHKPTAPQVRTRPSSDDAHEVVFFRLAQRRRSGAGGTGQAISQAVADSASRSWRIASRRLART